MIVKSLGKFGRSVVASAAVSVFTFPAQAALSPSGDTSGATDQAAIADAVASGGTVELDEGTFYVNAEILVDSACTVRGAGRDKTTVRQTVDKKKSNMIQRVFHLNHASAVLEDLTISGGYAYAGGNNVANNGTAVLVDSNGGTIRNCRITDNYMGMNVYSAVYLYSANALMEQTIVDNNQSLNTYDNKYGFPGTGVYVASGATVRNCLFYGNVNQSLGRNVSIPAVYADNGKVINCTITDNTGINGSGAYAKGTTGKFYNCIIYGNQWSQTVKDYAGSPDWDGTAANFIDCTFADPSFKDRPNNDYHLKSDSSARGVGNVTDVSLAGLRDLDGVVCLKDNKTDLGCYQYVAGGTVNFEIKVDSGLNIYTGGSVSFRASVDGDDPANYTYSWTFGEGGPTATGQAPTVTFPDGGRYYATLAVTNKQDVGVFLDTYADPVVVARAVIPLEDGDSLDDALEEALAGCKITMGEGAFSMTKSKTLPAGVTITGAGPDKTSVNLNGKQLVLNDAASYLAGCKVSGCDIAMNATGGGVVIDTNGGTVSNCWFDANVASLAYNSKGLCVTVKGAAGRVSHCTFTNNDMTFKNNAYGSCIAMTAGLVDNCLFCTNKAIYGGAIYISGGTIRNCTIMNNKAVYSSQGGDAKSWRGGGVYIDAATGVLLQNCIIYGNTAQTEGDEWYCSKTLTDEQREAMFVTCCLEDPKVDDTYHLTIGSGQTCVNKGTSYEGAEEDTDLDFKDRVSGSEIDIGCYEYVSSSTFACEIAADRTVCFPGESVGFHAVLDAEIDPADYVFAWDFGEPGLTSGQQNPTVTFEELGPHDVTLVITEAEGGEEVFRETKAGLVTVHTKTVEIAAGADLYVALSNLVDGQIFLLAAGEYECTNEVVVAKAVTIRGKGREATVLRMKSGANKRFFTLNNPGALLADLAMENGGFDSRPAYNAYYGGLNGGGVLIDVKGGSVTNCRVSGCQVGMNSSGMGIYLNSDAAHVSRCIVNDNFTLNNYPSGGAITVANGHVDNCLVVSNSITAGTRTYYVAAGISVSGGTVSNCTVSANAGHGVGGMTVSTTKGAVNCISYGNSVAKSIASPDAPDIVGEANCVTCLFADPLFVDAANGDFHLTDGSPAVNAATYGTWMDAAKDLDGRDRVKRYGRDRTTGEVVGFVDLGCYETNTGTLFFIK